MAALRKTVVEALVIGILGAALGFGANAVRGSGAVNLTRNYFSTGTALVAASQGGAGEDRSAGEGEEPDSGRPVHPYQEVSFEQVVEIFNDPTTEMGANVFIDARNDEAYEEGHIPGAIQADHYRLEDYIDNVLEYAIGADRVIVYCNGGDCEDSIFMCADLMEFDVPYDVIHLYPGGWKEWTAKGQPVATGREE